MHSCSYCVPTEHVSITAWCADTYVFKGATQTYNIYVTAKACINKINHINLFMWKLAQDFLYLDSNISGYDGTSRYYFHYYLTIHGLLD